MINLMATKKYRSLNTVQIRREALQHNHRVLQAFHPEAAIAPVLKSNAYGHGLREVAPIFDSFGAPFLVVDSLYEAYELYKLHIKTPVLIMGLTHASNFTVKKLPFHYALSDLATAVALNQFQPGANVHIFVDTGMCREGIPLKDLDAFLIQLKKLQSLRVAGLCSHFADADNSSDMNWTAKQINAYKKAYAMLQEHDYDPQYRHIAASGGAFKIQDPIFTMIRAGVASYGINPLDQSDAAFAACTLHPALRFCSTLVQIKEIKKGERVGYNGIFTAKKKMKVGLLPLGYYEGVDRRLSNKGVVTIAGVRCAILGRVSMNMTTIDLSNVPHAAIGDEVVIYSDDENSANSVSAAANVAETIPYELLVHIAESVKRIVI